MTTTYGTGVLQMPSNYVGMDAEEMEYLDGGVYYSKNQCEMALAVLCLNPNTIIAGALLYTTAKLLVKKVSALFGGVAGFLVGTVLSYAGAQIILFGTALARGALNNGVDITWNWNIFKDSIGISYSVK